MGRKSSWCTKEGLNARKLGMKKEKVSKKVCILIFFSCCAIFYISIGGSFASRSTNASSINSDFTWDKMAENAETIA